MLRLNKKLWSFNIGCLIAGSFIWLVGFSKTLPMLDVVLNTSTISIELYNLFVIAVSAFIISVIIITFMHKVLCIHSNEYTFWLVLPILSFLVLTSVVANMLMITMMSAAIPSLFVILFAARKRKERKIFDMKKALS